MDQIYYVFSTHYHNLLKEALHSDKPNLMDLMNKKLIHTFRVIDNAKYICHKEKLSEHMTFLAEVAALFHDIGRFNQAITFGHFSDLKSFDHAECSANIFKKNKENLTNQIKEEDFIKIEKAIRYHNKLDIPENEDEETILLSKILKDADKINILSINLKSGFIYFDGTVQTNEDITENCINSFLNKQVVNSKDVNSSLDNNIKMLSWIYDLHFKTSLEMYYKENFINTLTDITYIKNISIKHTILDLKDIATNYIETNIH